MAIQSMTAFACQTSQGEWGTLVWELRSVNHRYLEMSVYLPDSLRGLEEIVRERMRTLIPRGKVDASLRYQPNYAVENQIAVNMPLAKQLVSATQQIQNVIKTATQINLMDILRWPRVIDITETNLEVLQHEIINLLNKTLERFIVAREREGKVLQELLIQRLDAIDAELARLKPILPRFIQEQRAKILQRLAEAKVEFDPQRVEQEIVIIAHKSDVAEEIDRLQTHINEVRRNLLQGGSVGRRLDFLMQELNREANTLASKSSQAVITQISVEIKVLIEQMREQIQNIA